MKSITFQDFIEKTPDENGTIRMAIGVFDGIHLGHQHLLKRLSEGPETAVRYVFTFTHNPKVVLGRRGYDQNIITPQQKLSLLSQYRVDCVVLIDFSYEFSKLRGEEFFTMITNACNLEYVVVGENFSCGYKAAFTAERIGKWFEGSQTQIDIVPSVMFGSKRVSSSRVRKLLAHKRIEDANTLLGRFFSVDTANIPHEMGKRTFNIDRNSIRQILPPPGLYDAQFLFSGYSLLSGTLKVEDDILECNCERAEVNQLQEIKIRKRMH
ncbi:MAG: FAD synthetase family protein [Spirochaetota bacterium]